MFTKQTDRPTEAIHDPTLDLPFVGSPEPAAEAPDRGEHLSEPLEAAIIRHAEAPDAGDARAGLFEQDFTHGRSMS